MKRKRPHYESEEGRMYIMLPQAEKTPLQLALLIEGLERRVKDLEQKTNAQTNLIVMLSAALAGSKRS
jgi:hypothetical protein